jgi:hypothetical protein
MVANADDNGSDAEMIMGVKNGDDDDGLLTKEVIHCI